MNNIITARTLKIDFQYFMQRLPEDVRRMIYEEHFKDEIEYEEKYKMTMKLLNCNKIIYTNKILANRVKQIMENEKIMEYFSRKSTSFSVIYQQYKTNTLGYNLITGEHNRFTTAWILYVYH